jgi:prepilin-type N-terminal cleavage/methylation domain-containing protein
MTALLERARRRLRSERGFTLVELLMASVLGVLVLGVGVTVFTAAVRSQPGLTKRGDSISQARTSMERLTRELRQGAAISTATANQLSFVTYVHSPAGCASTYSSTSNPCRVTYTCTTMSCTRVQAKSDGSSPGASVIVVRNLTNPNVFNYISSQGRPTYIGATFVMAGQNGDDAITVSDGATVRNPNPPPQ